MSNFTVYTDAPDGLFLPYYMRTAEGGLNSCILGNTPNGEVGIAGANVLNNCVGWCQGRMMEVYNEVAGTQNSPTNPFSGCNLNAEEWYANYRAWGMTRQSTPAVGAIGCYRKVKTLRPVTYEGHVVFVERYDSNTGLWEVSESHFYFDGDQNVNGSWDYTTLNSRYYPPFIAGTLWQLQGFLVPTYPATLDPSAPVQRGGSFDILAGAYRKRNRRRFY